MTHRPEPKRDPVVRAFLLTLCVLAIFAFIVIGIVSAVTGSTGMSVIFFALAGTLCVISALSWPVR